MNELYTIEAIFIHQTDKALYLNCEGDKAWFSKSLVKYDEEESELTAPRWLLEQQIPGIVL